MADFGSPVLVRVDTETSMVFAHVCKRNGADPDILETLMEDIERPRESSQGSSERACSSATRDETGKQPKVSFSSKRHGGLKDALEANTKQAAGPEHHSDANTNHAATIINIFSVNQDGKTPMEKAHGTTTNREMAEFGDKVLIQPMKKCSKMNKLDVRWLYGLFRQESTCRNGHG